MSVKLASLDDAIFRSLGWFHNSGVLVNDGAEGIHERVWLIDKEDQLAKGDVLLEDHIKKYRRVDCALQTALAFDLCAEVTDNEQLRTEAQNLINFVFNNAFQELDEASQDYGLFAHAITRADAIPEKIKGTLIEKVVDGVTYWNKKWVDDNSWAVILSLKLSERGYDLDRDRVFECGQALEEKEDVLNEYCRGKIDQPHWGGMRALALATLASKTGRMKTLHAAAKAFDSISSYVTKDTSNLAYLAMQANAAASLGPINILDLSERATEALISKQQEDGHLPGDWWEGSRGDHIADLVYTQNWATLALQMAAQRNPKFRPAFEKSLNFLLSIQNQTNSPLTNGAWQGAYDTTAKAWGGEDKKEGGPSSIYSGWTNAPILTALAVEYLRPAKHPLLI